MRKNEVWCSVLLVEGKIFNWTIREYPFEKVEDFRPNFIENIKKIDFTTAKVKNERYEANSSKERDEAFNKKSIEFMSQWEVHPKADIFLPFDTKDFFPKELLEQKEYTCPYCNYKKIKKDFNYCPICRGKINQDVIQMIEEKNQNES